MFRRALRPALLLLAVVPALTACPVQPGGSTGAAAPTTTAAAAPATTSPASWVGQMLASVNAQRAAVGASPLTLCGHLWTAAQNHSDDQAAHSTMTHTGSDGSSLGDRANRAGYVGWTALGENVAAGQASVDSVMTAWMNSSGHRANLLSTTYVHVGFGRTASSGGTLYWTQDFGRSGAC